MFDVLNSSNSLTLEEVAGQINASVLGTERLLEAAVSLGLLERVKQQNTSGKIYVLPFYLHKWCYCRRNHTWFPEMQVLKPLSSLFIYNLQALSRSLKQGTRIHAFSPTDCLLHISSLSCPEVDCECNIVYCLLQCIEIQNRPVASWYQTAQSHFMGTFSTAMIWCGLSSVI